MASKRSSNPRKTAQKSAPAKRKPKHGKGMLLTGGMPGNKGGTGRPPKAFKHFVKELTDDDTVRDRVRTILTDKGTSIKDFKAMAELVWAYAQGKPKQALDVRTTRTLDEILSGKKEGEDDDA